MVLCAALHGGRISCWEELGLVWPHHLVSLSDGTVPAPRLGLSRCGTFWYMTTRFSVLVALR